jgi:flagellar motor switch protein FliN/FliY
MEVPLSLHAGEVRLPWEEFSKAAPGDFLILDHSPYLPRQKKGSMTLSFKQSPVFQVKLKDEGIKILDYATYREAIMSDEFDEDEFQFDQEDDLDFYNEEEQPVDEEIAEENGASDEQEEPKPSDLPPEKLVSPQQIDVNIHVELAQINMTMDTLLSLKPGNMIDLNIHPEQYAYLTINGKKVGKGQLLQIGETVGVKIIEIGAGKDENV